MNIFYLDKDPKTCAEQHLDKHVVKMLIEYAQLMSTAHRVLDGVKYIGKSKTGRKVTRYLKMKKLQFTKLVIYITRVLYGLEKVLTTITGYIKCGFIYMKNLN